MGVVLLEVSSAAEQDGVFILMAKFMQMEAQNIQQTQEYYKRASLLAEEITTEGRPEQRIPLVAKLLKSLISKFPPPEGSGIGGEDVWAMGKCAAYLATHVDFSVQNQDENIQLLSGFLGTIRSGIIKNYMPQRVTSNVVPPILPETGTGIIMAGMSPKAIADPVARRAYEKAIRKNNEINQMNRRQNALNDVNNHVGPIVIQAIRRNFSAGNGSIELLEEYMERAKHTGDEREEILKHHQGL